MAENQIRSAGHREEPGAETASGSLNLIVHEMRQPLTAIQYHTDLALLLLSSCKDARTNARLRRIVDAIVGAASLASGILQRIGDSCGAERHFLPTVEDVPTVISDVVDLLAFLIESHGVTLTKDIGAGTATMDRILIAEVLVNLIRNALAVTEIHEGHIHLSAFPDGSSWQFVVADNGTGIAEEMRSQLFKPIENRKGHGLGVGLAISKQIIDLHGGAIWYTPNVPDGARIHFTLPANAE